MGKSCCRELSIRVDMLLWGPTCAGELLVAPMSGGVHPTCSAALRRKAAIAPCWLGRPAENCWAFKAASKLDVGHVQDFPEDCGARLSRKFGFVNR